jgi:hypothetical protein
MRPGARDGHHPWRRFSRLTDWTLLWAQLPVGVLALTCHRTRTVTLTLGLSQAERRCTIAHETEHILRGPVAGHEARREELAIEQHVAGLLLPDAREVAAAVAGTGGDLEAAADELWVDDYVLQTRLADADVRRCIRRSAPHYG